MMKMSRVIVTGGAGFIGSHLTNFLARNGYQVKVLDNFSVGKIENIDASIKSKITLTEVDIRNMDDVRRETAGADVIFHLAADPDVRTSSANPNSHYENNVKGTFNILEAMRQNAIKNIAFTSSSVVYGDSAVLPTPENSILDPISIYGTTKLICEELIAGYVKMFDMKALIFRPANIIGANGTHGVILDFIRKLKSNPNELEILGDGTQNKSYLLVSDCVKAMLTTYGHFKDSSNVLEIYNIGNTDSTTVLQIAQFVIEEMCLKNVKLNLTGGVDGGRGWRGDVRKMLLATSKLNGIGWQSTLPSSDAVKRTIVELLH